MLVAGIHRKHPIGVLQGWVNCTKASGNIEIHQMCWRKEKRQEVLDEVNKQSLLTTMTTVQHTNTDFLATIHNANLETFIESGNLQLLQALQELTQLQ